MCSEHRKTLKAPVTFLQHHRDLGDIICAMVIISLNLEGSYVRISVHNAHGHQTLHCGISEDTVFLMGSFVSGGMRLGEGGSFCCFTANSLSGFFSPLRIGREYSNRWTSLTL